MAIFMEMRLIWKNGPQTSQNYFKYQKSLNETIKVAQFRK